MPTWKKEFRGSLIDGTERPNSPAMLKIDGLAVALLQEDKNLTITRFDSLIH